MLRVFEFMCSCFLISKCLFPFCFWRFRFCINLKIWKVERGLDTRFMSATLVVRLPLVPIQKNFAPAPAFLRFSCCTRSCKMVSFFATGGWWEVLEAASLFFFVQLKCIPSTVFCVTEFTGYLDDSVSLCKRYN